ncbi:MAG: BamA/TamA family outer membrane protein [Negativicutes bacterium]|nr:BamA/TamA family outer membrane protein [Negativicutes bacterium]
MRNTVRFKKSLWLMGLGIALTQTTVIAYGAEAEVTNATLEEAVDEGPVGQRITRVDIEGLSLIEKDSILALVGSHPGETWTAEQTNKDLEAILASGYFQAARMTYNIVPEGAQITYHVIENPVFKGLSLTGNTRFSTEELQAMATVTPGVIINTNRLASDLQIIEEYYKKQGYILARVTNIKMSPDGLVSAQIVEGIIEGIEIKGNKKTRDRTIRREIRVKPGEPLQSVDARNSIRRLNNLGIFEDVRMNLQPGRQPNEYVYQIEVAEAPTRSFSLGGGYSEDDGFTLGVELSDKNFLGLADTIRLRWEFGGESESRSSRWAHGIEFGYTHPWLTSNEMSVSFNYYDLIRRRTDRDTNGDDISQYDRRSSGFDLTFTQPYGEYKRAFLGVGSRTTKWEEHISGIDYSTVPGYIDNNFGTTNSVTLGFIFDNRDNAFNATTGHRLSLSVDQGVSAFGSDFSPTKFNLDARKYWPIQVGKAQHTVAIRLLGGMAVGDVPETELFSVGGDNVLKGYEEGQFRGRNMLAATLEYRVPIQKYITAIAFVEGGDAWDAGSNAIFSEPGRSFKLRANYGLGVRLNTPLGPIRLDYAVPTESGGDGRFSFGFGASF